jgi:hypothetical protein
LDEVGPRRLDLDTTFRATPTHLSHGEGSIAEIPNLRNLEAEVSEGLEVVLKQLADLLPSPIDRRLPFEQCRQPGMPLHLRIERLQDDSMSCV